MENKVKILKTDINQIKLNDLSNRLINEESLDVAVCNANSLVRSYKDKNLQKFMNDITSE